MADRRPIRGAAMLAEALAHDDTHRYDPGSALVDCITVTRRR